jgi:hypothetical protein
MTRGEYRVGVNFNPSADDTVTHIKEAAAALIDMIETIPGAEMRDVRGSEVGRLKALAQTAIEEGAMWAVKAATKGSPQ